MSDITSNVLSVLIDGITIDYKRETNNCRVNLTKMAKPFGKRVNDWLNLPTTQDYLTLLQCIVSVTRFSGNVEPLIVTKQLTLLAQQNAELAKAERSFSF